MDGQIGKTIKCANQHSGVYSYTDRKKKFDQSLSAGIGDLARSDKAVERVINTANCPTNGLWLANWLTPANTIRQVWKF